MKILFHPENERKFFIMEIGKYISLALLIWFFAGCNQDRGKAPEGEITSRPGDAEMVFTKYEHDFGKVTEGEKVAYVFSFENKGPGNLVLNSTSTTCGCTVTKYDSKPIAPGGHGTLEVAFDTSGRNGKQTKSITVHSNSKIPVVVLKISAEVVQRDRRN